MLKKVIVTNYKGESTGYKISEDIVVPDKNKLVIYNEEEMRSNNSDPQGTWESNTYTNRGVTFTINRDDEGRVTSIHVKGKAVNRSVPLLISGHINSDSDELILSGCIGGSSNTYSMTVGIFGEGTDYYQYDEEEPMSNTSDYDAIRIWAEQNAEIDTYVYPMVRLASESSEFQPYDPHGGEPIESNLFITSIEGLGPGKANINMSELATSDGSVFNSARLSGRNIVFKAYFTDATTIEESRHLSYKYFPIKTKVKINVITDDRNLTIEGYVESNEPDIFSKQSGCQISVLCESFYFSGQDSIWQIGTDGTALECNGDVETGVDITVETDDYASGTISVTKVDDFGSEVMTIDTMKFASTVPKTSPDGSYLSSCIFTIDEEENYEYTSMNNNRLVLSAPLYDGLHLLSPSENGDHYKLVMKQHRWIAEKIDSGGFGLGTGSGEGMCLVANDGETLHVISHNIYNVSSGTENIGHKSWTKASGWKYESDSAGLRRFKQRWSTSPYSTFLIDTLVELDGELYLLGRYTRTDTSYRPIKLFILQLSKTGPFAGEWVELTPTYSTMDDIDQIEKLVQTSIMRAIVYDGEIHVFFQFEQTSADYTRCHYTVSSNGEWTRSFAPPIEFFEHSDILYSRCTVFKGKLHMFGAGTNFHFVWSEDDQEWIRLSDLEHIYSSPPAINGECSTDDLIFVIGNSYTGVRYSRPDNSKGIEKWDIIEISTIKGRKGIYLWRYGERMNVINSLDRDSSWITIRPGVCVANYRLVSDDGNELLVNVGIKDLYQGV